MSANPQGSNPATSTIRPPQLIRSLVGGFNTAANNVTLLVLPILIDLLLWFGPHLSVRGLFGPLLADMLRFTRQNSQPEMRPLLDNFETVYQVFLERFNLFSALSTFPVGVPSQMAASMPQANPLGAPQTFEVSSFGQLALGWLALTLLGFLIGSLYFALISHATGTRAVPAEGTTPAGAAESGAASGGAASAGTAARRAITPGSLGWLTGQVILMTLLLLILAMAILVPAALFSTFLALISPLIGQFVLLLVSFGLIWFLFPLVFAPHGIFASGQNALIAMLNSARMVRLSLPSTGLFLITLVIMHQGLGTLWNSAPTASWLGVVGIFGRAFITTALLAASFMYYRAGLRYQQSLRRV